MNSKSLWILILFVLSFNQLYSQNNKDVLDELIKEAINVSPKIKLLESKLKVASARIEHGTNLPDPVLTLGLMNMPTNSFSFTQEPMTGKSIGLTQAIPYPSGLSAAADVKAIDTLIIQEEIKNLQNLIRKEVSGLFYDLRLTKAEIKLNEDRLNLLEQILEVVKSKSEVNEASMQNIVQVKVEITKVKDNLQKLAGTKETLSAELNSILLRDKSKTINSGQIEISKFEEISPLLALKIAEEYQPKLKEIKFSGEKSELMQRQAEYEFYPNFSIGVQYTQRDYHRLTGTDYNDFLSVIAGITLPINYGSKKTAKIDEAKYLQMLNKEEYESEIQDLNRSINIITVKISELKKRKKIITDTLLPLANQSLKIALSDYQVGRIDFVNVINAEKEILTVKTDLYRIQTEYDQNNVMLEFLIGTTLEETTHSNGDIR